MLTYHWVTSGNTSRWFGSSGRDCRLILLIQSQSEYSKTFQDCYHENIITECINFNASPSSGGVESLKFALRVSK